MPLYFIEFAFKTFMSSSFHLAPFLFNCERLLQTKGAKQGTLKAN